MVSRRHNRTKIFISYSHRDKHWLDRLLVHLKPLERDLGAEIWDDTKIKPGARWMEEIQAALRSAQVAILLISADFLGSDFISKDELPPLLKAAKNRGVDILPLILSPCGYSRNEALSQFQAFNNSEPLIELDTGGQERVFERVAEYIAALLKSKTKASKRTPKKQEPVAGYNPPPKTETESNSEPPVATEPKSDSKKPTDEITSDQQPPTKKERSNWLRAIAAVSILLAIVVLVVIAIIKISGPSPDPGKPKTNQSNTQTQQIPGSKTITLFVEKGQPAVIAGLSINVHNVRLDPDSKKFKVSATIQFPGYKILEIPDREVSDKAEYNYSGNDNFIIRVLSANDNGADFEVKKMEK